jgi:hypothetical protein
MGYDDFVTQDSSSYAQISQISYMNDSNEVVVDPGPGPYLARWTSSPVVNSQLINQNLFQKNSTATFARACIKEKEIVFRSFEFGEAGSIHSSDPETSFFATLRSFKEGKEVNYLGDPMAGIYLPVFDNLDDIRTASVVAVMASVLHWRSCFRYLLPNTVNGIDVVVDNTCGASYTYRINGTEAYPLGFGDLHDTRFDKYRHNATFEAVNEVHDGSYEQLHLSRDGCIYRVDVYPSTVS